MNQNFMDSDRRCPRDRKLMVVEIGPDEDARLSSVHTCLDCGFTETVSETGLVVAASPKYKVEHCRSCNAPIIWAATELGKSMPVNAAIDHDGNVALQWRGDRPPLAMVLGAGKRFGKRELYTSHFANCRQASEWRRKPVAS